MEIGEESQNLQTHDRMLVIERIFDVPRELVWKAWTDPALVARWWGPTQFTMPSVQIDLRVGGKYLNCMRSPEGQDYWATGRYLEIDYPNKIVATDSFADEHGNVIPATNYGMEADIPLELLMTIILAEYSPRRTKFTLQHEGMPAGELTEQVRASWNESFDKLEKLLVEIL